eukprot:jgi/Mesvir1/19311/Mv10378-RA.1
MQASAHLAARNASLAVPDCTHHGHLFPHISLRGFRSLATRKGSDRHAGVCRLRVSWNHRSRMCRADSEEKGRIAARRNADTFPPAKAAAVTKGELKPSTASHPPQKADGQRTIQPLSDSDPPVSPHVGQHVSPSSNPVQAALERLFSRPMTAEVAAIALVYFVQGVLGLSRLAVSFFLKDDLGLDPAEMAIVTGISSTPWLIKPLYGILSDSIPLFGYRRRSYLVLCGLLGASAWAYMCLVADSPAAAIAAITASSLAVAFSDVVADSIVVERARHEPPSEQGVLQSLSWGAYAFGGIATAYFSGSLVASYGPRFVFGATAVLPLIISGVGLLVDEKPVSNNKVLPAPAPAAPESSAPLPDKTRPVTGASLSKAGSTHDDLDRNSVLATSGRSHTSDSSSDVHAVIPAVVDDAGDSVMTDGSTSSDPLGALRHQLLQLWIVIQQRNVWLPALFVFVWQSTPHAESAMFYFTTNQLGFGPEFLGTVRLVTHVATLGGVILYNTTLKRVPISSMLMGTALVGTALGLTQLILIYGINRQLGISDEFFTMGESLAISTLGQLAFMPVLVLAARICPPGVEATLFAALMSISNGAGMVGGFMGAGLTKYLGVTSDNFTNLGLLVIICNLSSLLPLPLLPLLSKELVKPEEPGEEAPGTSSTGDATR